MRRTTCESSTLNFQFLKKILGIRVYILQELHHKNKVNGQWFLKVYEEIKGFFLLFIFAQN